MPQQGKGSFLPFCHSQPQLLTSSHLDFKNVIREIERTDLSNARVGALDIPHRKV